MSRFPYINFPFPFYKGYPQTPTSFPNYSNSTMRHPVSTSKNNTNNIDNTNSSEVTNSIYKNDNNYSTQKNKSNKSQDDFLFDLFGLKIYNDDVLLVSLIYFLYSEDVKDDSLFLVLILLLLS